MIKLSRFRALVLLAVLGCLLCLAAAGCSDDHDYSVHPGSTPVPSPSVSPEPSPSPSVSPEPSPSPSVSPEPSPSPEVKELISYLFKLNGTAKVSTEASEVALTAYDEKGTVLKGASLAETSLDALTREDDYYVAEAAVPDDAALLVFTFRHGGVTDGVYAIGLTDGVYRYVMSYNDEVAVPEFKVYADAEHGTAQSSFRVGDALYPAARAVSNGGLEIPIASIMPLDFNVVSYAVNYTSSGSEDVYRAASPGQTAFVVAFAEAEFETAASVTVESIPAWILPESYEIKNGRIYLDDAQISDPADIETKVVLQSGASCRCRIVAAAGGSGADAVYEVIAAEVSAEIESAAAEHFSVKGGAGEVTVSVSAEAGSGESASVKCAAEGFAVQNTLEVTSAALRSVTVVADPEFMGFSEYLFSDEILSKYLVKAVALDDSGKLIEGARCLEEDVKKLSVDSRGYTSIEAEVPETAASLIVFAQISWNNNNFHPFVRQFYPSDDVVMPLFGISLDENDEYSVTEDNAFCYNVANDEMQYGPYADSAYRYSVLRDILQFAPLGVQLYFKTDWTNGCGITIEVSNLHPENTSVLNDSLRTVGYGSSAFLGNWYGLEGAVWFYNCACSDDYE